MKKTRVSKKRLRLQIENINFNTKHKVDVFFTQGCGIILTVNGKEYRFKTNKEAHNFLDPYWDEARINVIKSLKE